jgi:hypothetical protein
VRIGARPVEKSERLSARVREAGIAHQVLNGRQDEQKADVVAQAGRPGRVTIATNMAGSGTDIKLGPGVVAAGGLHVLGAERHDAQRIDRQLAGRAARQGDPGSVQFFLSLEDESQEGLGPRRQAALQRRGQGGGRGDWAAYEVLFRWAQRRVERRHYRQRVDLLAYAKQRQDVLKDLSANPYVGERKRLRGHRRRPASVVSPCRWLCTRNRLQEGAAVSAETVTKWRTRFLAVASGCGIVASCNERVRQPPGPAWRTRLGKRMIVLLCAKPLPVAKWQNGDPFSAWRLSAPSG